MQLCHIEKNVLPISGLIFLQYMESSLPLLHFTSKAFNEKIVTDQIFKAGKIPTSQSTRQLDN